VLAAVLGFSLLATGSAQAAAGPVWSTVATPSVAPLPNTLTGVAAISPRDVWAVGNSGAGSAQPQGRTLHWDGAAWLSVPAPSDSMYASTLTSVDVASAGDVWAVGHAVAAPGASRKPLVMRYTYGGWSVVPTPSPGPAEHELNGVDMPFPGFGWAVGTYRSGSSARLDNLILRWNGSVWTQMPAPVLGSGSNVLKAVAAEGAGQGWAVGYRENASDPDHQQAVILRWNGGAWQPVFTPNPGTGSNVLNSVVSISPTDAWAVGFSFDAGPNGGYLSRRPLALHWNGATWTAVPTTDPEALEYTDVAAVSGNDVYLVGYRGRTVDNDFVMRWDGVRLIPEQVILPGTATVRRIGSALFSVSVAAPGDLWAVGHLEAVWTHALHRTAG
jgi:hypothetical protein